VDEVRFNAGLAVTGLALSSGHWFPWWKRLTRKQAYVIGSLAILLGQGFYLGFNKVWRRLAAFVLLAGIVVQGAYLYDELANARARARALVGGTSTDGIQDTDQSLAD
jgi:hypothetical protein